VVSSDPSLSSSNVQQEMRAAFEADAKKTNKDRLLLSAAVAAGLGNIQTAYEIPVLGQ